jgi:DNA-binding CsgD family transcriptional regulator/pimeloyl-ACP methyl ester carboxylesterase
MTEALRPPARPSGGVGPAAHVVATEVGHLPEQAIGFFPHRGRQVAYAVTGAGPLLLLDVGRAHHLEVFWGYAPYRRFVQRLSPRFTVVRWDRPGFGLSDRWGADLSPDGELALVERLVSFLGADDTAILAAGDAGPIMVRFAARHPERVSRLALFGTAASGRLLLPALPEAALELLAGVSGSAIHQVLAAALAAGSEPEVESWLASALEASADASTMVSLIAGAAAHDARLDAVFVRAPALVVHRTNDAMVEPWLGMALGTSMRSAEFVELDGGSHLLFAEEMDSVLATLVPFLAEGGESEPMPLSHRELQVAQMVTLGITNAEIGRRLAIRPRTVDAHMEHIRAKLGVSSRARIAAWSVRNHPTGAVRKRA